MGTTPISTILLRNIDSLVTEADIAAAFTRLFANVKDSSAAPNGGLKRVMLVKDRKTTGSWGFAFVQFVDTPVRASRAAQKHALGSL